MHTFWFVVYNVFLLPLLWLLLRIVSLFNTKIKDGFRGRKEIFKILSASNPVFLNGRKNIIIHSSSLGEYQQAIPLIDKFTSKGYNIICTFFSPSGYNHSKITNPDVIKIYLPFDFICTIKKFYDRVSPAQIILMRYDLWFNFLNEARKRNINVSVANARFDEKDAYWKMIAASSFKKSMYNMLDTIFVIDKEDESNYKSKLKNFKGDIIRVGDSKYERVFESLKDFKKANPLDEKITKGKKIFVIGSSWKDDEDVLLPAVDKILEYEPSLLTVLVPHEPKLTKIQAIEKAFEQKYKNIRSIRFSAIGNYNGENLIIVDSIGLLAALYKSAYISYVGGGFRTGMHNILEPVIFNVPVYFANQNKNSDEDERVLEAECGKSVTDKKQFYRELRMVLKDESYRNKLSVNCKKVFEKTLGTADKIVNKLTNE